MSDETLHRLEGKVDILTAAITKLVLFEERQAVQQLAIGSLTAKLDATESKLDQWVNRGIGVWGLALVAFSVWKALPT